MAPENTSAAEEDDLDDLDDIVDQFDPNPPKPDPSSKIPSAAQPHPAKELRSSAPSSSNAPDPKAQENELPEDLAKQLAESMENFMRELAGTQAEPVGEEERKLREEWEKMLIEGMNGVSVDESIANTTSVPAPGVASSSRGAGGDDEFQKSIRAAMEKLKSSDSTLQSDASASAATTDPLESILSQLGSEFEGEDNAELQGMLETMMRQLMSKEVLYEPLKELHDKFPGYIQEHQTTLTDEEKTRYQKQLDKVTEIVTLFEDPSYTDEDQEKGTKVVALMNEMQSYGSPPAEIMGPMPPGLDFGPDGTPKLPEGCIIS